MAVSISELRDFAMDGGADIGGNIITLSDIGDDLGASLLSNKNIAPAPAPAADRAVSFNMGSSSLGANDIQVLEPLDSIPLDVPLGNDPLAPSSGGGATTFSVQRESSPWNSGGGAGLFSNEQTSSASDIHLSTAPLRDPEAERKEKSDLINKLNRLESKGYPVSRKFTMDNSLEEIKGEFERLTDARKLEASIKFQRQMMMGLVTGIEMMNEKFDPFDVELKGWSESVNENIDDFDEVFEELYDKYKGKGNMPPEARLIFMLAGSGFMFHMSNSFYRKKELSMDDIFRQNPGLRQQFAAAAAQAAGPGFGNFMGMAMGGGGPGPAPVQPQAPLPPTGMFYGSSSQLPPQVPQSMAAAEPARAPRREMRGPSGVDDILKTFDEVRRAETEPMFNPFGAGATAGGAAAMMAEAPPAQPAVSAASEIQSVMTGAEEISSTGEPRRGGGRRRKAQPIGNTVTLNV